MQQVVTPDGSCYWQYYMYRPGKVINYDVLCKYYSGIRYMSFIFLRSGTDTESMV